MLNRRQFLKRLAALGLSSAGLSVLLEAAACSPEPSPSPAAAAIPPAEPTAAKGVATPLPSAVSPTAAPAAGATATSAATASPSYLSVVHGDDPAELTRRAVKSLGGIERFVQPGQKVIIKPNICVAYHSPEYAATTNPQVVAALVTMCLSAGAASVQVMDHPFGGTAEEAYKVSQIGEAVAAAGGEMVLMAPLKFKMTDIPMGKAIKKWEAYQDALKADVLINVPIAKHHSLARLTLGGKNLLGLVENRGRLMPTWASTW